MSESGKQGGAGVDAAAAGVGTDAAVVVHVGVLGALVGAQAAHCEAGLDDGAGDGDGWGDARENGGCGRAHAGAIQVVADPAGQLGDHVFGEAGVGAARAGAGAIRGGVGGGREGGAVEVADVLGGCRASR